MKQACTLFLLLIVGGSWSMTMAQQRKAFIAGMVQNETGVPLTGVSIQALSLKDGGLVEGKTNEKGVYRIDNLQGQESYKVTFRHLGFETFIIDKYEFRGLQQTWLKIKMKGITTPAGVAVETGYATELGSHITGSVAVVDVNALKTFPVAGINQALQGVAAGVNVMADGQPGGGVAVRIRGYSTVGNNDPLFVIDGLPVNSSFQLPPSDFIASVQLLKDASAAAIYGARAANGVVIITTKKGDAGKTQLTYSGFGGLQQVGEAPSLLNAQQFGDTYFKALKNDGILANHSLYGRGANAVVPEFLNVGQTIYAGDTNWYNEVYEDAPIQSHHLLLRSGSETGRQAFGVGYYQQDGLLKYTDFKRYSLRLNTDFNLAGRLKIGENLAVAYAERRVAPTNMAIGGVTGNVYKAHPMANVYDVEGEFAGPVTGLNDVRNPLAQLVHQKNNVGKNLSVLGNIFAELTLVKGLTLKTNFGMDYHNIEQHTFNAAYDEGPLTNQLLSDLSEKQVNAQTRVWTNTLNFNKVFTSHAIGLLVGSEDVEGQTTFLTASRVDFPGVTTSPVHLDNGSGIMKNSGSGIRSGLFSLFAKANYSYMNRFLLTASIRRDQFSKLTDGHNTLFFPGFSAGWRISEMPMFREYFRFMSNLKLRFGWGKTGNLELAPFAAYSSFGIDPYHSSYAIDGGNYTVIPGISLRHYGNNQLNLEQTTQLNYGLDLGLFKDRVALTVDYFIKDTENLIVQNEQAAVTGQAAAPYFNGGSMHNRGLEISGLYRSKSAHQFKFEIGGNITFLKQELSALHGDISYLSSLSQNEVNMGLSLQRTTVGQPIASFYGHQVLGIFQTAEEVADAPEQIGKAPGRLRYADLNSDGLINDKDRKFLGSPVPTLTYGFNLTAVFKMVDLSVFFQGVSGNKIYNLLKYHNDFFFDQYSKSERILNAWTPQNTGSTIPALSTTDINNELRPSSYFIEDGAYLRLKNLQLGVSLPASLAKRIRVAKIRTYVQGQDLFTRTKYSGLDPEVGMQNYSTDQRNLDMGIDRGVYPKPAIYTLGLQVEF
jgi:TonB-linked SusC/RagA family outer membrane protein